MLGEPEGPGIVGSIILGVVEGLTEFLPVSSTGHLIVANAFLGTPDATFEVAIQLGAITAIAVLYWNKLIAAARTIALPSEGQVNLLWLILFAALPPAILGLLFEEEIEEFLFSPTTVAIALIAGGLLLWMLEGWLQKRTAAGDKPTRAVESMTVRQAVGIGLFQCLALIPGTSRSGATIAGGLVLGLGRTASAEFSFLVGLPILYGASLLKMYKDWERVSGPLLWDLVIGAVVSFVTALLIVRPFVRYLQNHTFVAFAIYRILAGAVVLVLIAVGVL